MNILAMKKTVFTLLLVLAASATLLAQRTPELDELIPGGKGYKPIQNLYGLSWWSDLCVQPERENVTTINPRTGERNVIFTIEQVNKALSELAEREKLTDGNSVTHLYNVQLLWPDRKEALIATSNKYVVYNFGEDNIVEYIKMDEENSSTDYCAASNRIAYTVGNDLYVDGTNISAAIRSDKLRETGEKVENGQHIKYGQSVHRNEFGINKGTFWSPKGHKLAFYELDESMVTEYPLVDISTRIAELKGVRYPMAGMTSHKVRVGIYNPTDARQYNFLETGDPTDRYFTNISWSPDEKYIYLIEVNRDQNHSKLCRYDAATGKLDAVLIEETHPKYVEPQNPIVFLPWDDTKFIYQSQRDGYNHLYLYDTTGKMIKQLTSGQWLVQDILGFTEKKKEIVIASTEYSPLQTNTFSVSIPSGKRYPVGGSDGVHNASLSASGTYLIDNYSTPDFPRKIDLVDIQKNKSINLLTASDPYESYDMPTIETGIIKAADGVTDLYYRLVKPVGFDENKKYPAIVYVYGGPHAQMIRNSWQYSARGWDIYMASQGYVMFTVDNRGSSNRGLEFENCTFRRLGIEEGKDQVKGIEFLGTLPYVDTNRIGVHGWSYGGHMTTALMLRYPDIYKVGVAGGPVIDWKYYEIMYGERYMDSPQDNPEGYKESNLNNLAGNLKGRLMMVHDDMDDTCVPQHTYSFIKACIKADTYPDLFIYPGHKHNVFGVDRVHLHEKITRYFKEHL